MSRVPSRSTRGVRAAAATPAVAGFRPAAAALAVAAAFAVHTGQLHAQSVPIGAIHGSASFTRNGSNLLVTTTNGAGTAHSAIDWRSFSVPGGSVTHFQQPTAASTSINRVLGPDPSAIFGTLSSNGKLVLVNPAGITVGKGALVDTAAFTAMTLRMSDADALAGRIAGSADGAGVLQVDGHVIARSGDVVLIGSKVQTGSEAVVQADGAVVLAAGQKAELTGRGLEGIHLEVQGGNEALNLGTLQGDAVGIFANTLRHSGLVQAQAVTSEGGRVVLKATGGDAIVAGTIAASAAGGKGGSIDVLGERVGLVAGAQLQANGALGGGQVRVGGDYQGQNPDVPNAKRVYFDASARIEADAMQQGNGGRVIVWSDEVTRMHGQISARGGTEGGNGGFAEVSGKQYLEFTGLADMRAPQGSMGTLLLDPQDVTIVRSDSFSSTVGTFPKATTAPTPGSNDAKFEPTTSTGPVTLADSHLNAQLNAGNVIVKTDSTDAAASTGGQIKVNSDAIVQWSSGADLAFEADKGIEILGTIKAMPNTASPPVTGGVHLVARNGSITDGGTGVIQVPRLYASATGGSVVLNGNHAVTQVAGNTVGAGTSFSLHSTQAVIVGTVSTAWGSGTGVISQGVTLASDQALSIDSVVDAGSGAIALKSPTLAVGSTGAVKRSGVGDVSVTVDGLGIAGSIESIGGRVVINPLTVNPTGPGVAIVGGGGVLLDGGFNLSNTDLDKIQAKTLVIGNGGLDMPIALIGNVSLLPTRVQELSLITARDISQFSGTLNVSGVNLDGRTVFVANPGNQVDTVSGRYDDTFDFHSDRNLSIGTVDGIAGVQVVAPTVANPDLFISSLGNLTANANVSGVFVALEGSTVQLAGGTQVTATGANGLIDIIATGVGTNNLSGGSLSSGSFIQIEGDGTFVLGNVTAQALSLVEGATAAPTVFQQGAGAIKASVFGSLDTDAGSSVQFLNAGNEIGSLSLSVAGELKVASSINLDVGFASGTNVQLKGANVFVGVESAVNATGNVDISGTGSGSTIDATGGFISAGGNVGFGNAGDVILGGVSTNTLTANIAGSLSQDPFTFPPTLDAPGGITLNVGGSVDLAGNLGYVTGSAGGSIIMAGVNGVGAAGLSAGSDIELSSQGPAAAALVGGQFLAALVPTSPGDLDLVGNVTAAGTVTLISPDSVVVQDTSTVSGTSLQMNAPLTSVHGTLKPGGNGGIGSANVAGDLFIGGTGSVQIDVASLTSFDTLNVTGVATTAAAASLQLVDLTGGTATGSFTPTSLGAGSSLTFGLPAANWSASATQPYVVTIGAVVPPPPPPPPAPAPVAPEPLPTEEVVNQVTTFATLFLQEAQAQQEEEAKENEIGKDDIVITETACK